MRKRMVLWMLTLCLLLTGCAGIGDQTEPTGPATVVPVLGYDAQNQYRGVIPGVFAFQETEDVFCGSG